MPTQILCSLLMIGATYSNQEGPKTITIETFDHPAIESSQWMVKGRIRHQDVEGQTYLETWNYVGDGAYFTRTLAATGPMKVISGTSDWREFELPFDASSAGLKPDKVVFNIVFAGKGTIEIDGIELIEIAPERSVPPLMWFIGLAVITGAILFGIRRFFDKRA